MKQLSSIIIKLTIGALTGMIGFGFYTLMVFFFRLPTAWFECPQATLLGMMAIGAIWSLRPGINKITLRSLLGFGGLAWTSITWASLLIPGLSPIPSFLNQKLTSFSLATPLADLIYTVFVAFWLLIYLCFLFLMSKFGVSP